jgi:hypothetical protein
VDTMIRQLNFRGDIRATMEPRVYDTYHGPMIPAVVEYDEEVDVTRLGLVDIPTATQALADDREGAR